MVSKVANIIILLSHSRHNYNNFMIVDFPGSPMNIEIDDKMYGVDSSNVTLIWTPPVVAKRLAHYRIELLLSETMSKELIVNTTEVNVKDIPYNQETTVSISAVNDCSGEGMRLNFSFIIRKHNNIIIIIIISCSNDVYYYSLLLYTIRWL